MDIHIVIHAYNVRPLSNKKQAIDTHAMYGSQLCQESRSQERGSERERERKKQKNDIPFIEKSRKYKLIRTEGKPVAA